MAGAALGVAKHMATFLGRRFALRLDHGQRITGRTVAIPIARTLVAVLAAGALTTAFAFGFGAWRLDAGAFVARRPVIAGPIVTGLLIARTIVAGTVITRAVAIAVAVLAGLPIAAIPVAGAVAVLAVRTPIAIPRAVVAVASLPFAVPGPALSLVGVLAGGVLARFAGLTIDLGVRGGFVRGDRLGPARFVLEVDVITGGELVATDDLAGRAGGLQGAQQAEIVLRVLKVVLGEDPVPGGAGVTGQLLVLFEDVLGVAAHLHAIGAVRIERAVGVVRLGLAAAAAATRAATTPIAPALALHTLEISHNSETVRSFPSVPIDALVFSVVEPRPGQSCEDVCFPRLPPGSSSA